MLAKALACSVIGLERAILEVEVHIAQKLRHFGVVGLPGVMVQEARERVKAAVKNAR